MAIVAVSAPMAATVFEVLVEVGEAVEADQEVIVLESMKMEVPVTAPQDGTVTEILVAPTTPVSEGDVLFRIETAD